LEPRRCSIYSHTVRDLNFRASDLNLGPGNSYVPPRYLDTHRVLTNAISYPRCLYIDACTDLYVNAGIKLHTSADSHLHSGFIADCESCADSYNSPSGLHEGSV
jgi:hypothetical protein